MSASTAAAPAQAPVDAIKTPAPPSGADNSSATKFEPKVAFDVSLLHGIEHGGAANVFVSPFMVEALLTLLYLGADGETAVELRRQLQLQRFSSNSEMAKFYALHLALTTNTTSDTSMTLRSHIVLPTEQTAGEELRHIAHKYFGTLIEQVGSAAMLDALLAERLGKEVARREEVAAAAAAATDACVTLSTAFKFKWFLPFSAYRTGIYDFHMYTSHKNNNNNNNNNNINNKNNNGDSISSVCVDATEVVKAVPMLFDDDMFVKFGEFRELDARAIELPCEHDELELTMLVLLPNRRDGLPQLLQQLRHTDLSTLAEQRMQMESVQVLLPKFSIDCTCTLRDALQEFGITTIFNKLANLKHLASVDAASTVKIANIWHNATIAVNESGSEPSNVTSLKPIVISNSLNAKQKFFRADHPFYFAIRAGDVTYFAGLLSQCGAT